MGNDLESGEPHEHASGQDATFNQRQPLRERAQQLGATAAELQAALDSLALQAEAVLRRLRGNALH